MTLGHLHDTTITADSLQGYGVSGVLVLLKCVGPVVLATALAGLLAGAIQNRFNTASEVLDAGLEPRQSRGRLQAHFFRAHGRADASSAR